MNKFVLIVNNELWFLTLVAYNRESVIEVITRLRLSLIFFNVLPESFETFF